MSLLPEIFPQLNYFRSLPLKSKNRGKQYSAQHVSPSSSNLQRTIVATSAAQKYFSEHLAHLSDSEFIKFLLGISMHRFLLSLNEPRSQRAGCSTRKEQVSLAKFDPPFLR